MKTKANSRVLQVTSGLLASVLLLSALPCTAFAASGVEKSAVPNEPETADNAIALDAAVPEEALTSVELSEYTVPSGMTLEELSDQGYTERVYGAETNLYSAVLSDGKGNYTLYYYDSPIKYVDEDGVVRDKILQPMALPDGGYRTRQSDILTTFSPNLTDGIKLEREDQSIRLTPLEAEAQAALTVDSARVAYAVDVATRYEYTLTPMGFKEDIIVESYTGQTEYSFLLETNGLTLVEEYGTYHLVDEYNTVQAYLGDIILFTADERNNTFGSMTAQTVEEGQSYLLTIELDEDWLSDPDTRYPITVDPTVNYSTSENIEDVSIVSTTTHAGDSGSLYVGRGSSGAALRSLMRFPNLNIRGYSVTKATVSIRELLCEDTVRPVECREFTGNSWSESGTTTWSGVGNSAGGTLYGTYNVCYDEGVKQAERHRYEYDITALAKKWAAGTSSPSKGLVFRSTDSYEASGDKSYCAFASINRGTNPPMLTVEYTTTTPSITLNKSSATLYVNDTLLLVATTTPSGSTVSWKSKSPSVADVNSNGLVTAKAVGSTTITASADAYNRSASCNITVLPRSLSIRTTNDFAFVGSSIQLSAKTTPSESTVTWSSEDESIATVNQTGLVTIHKLGEVEIKASLVDGTTDFVTVYGVLRNGVYKLQNAGSYLYVTNDSTSIFQNQNVEQTDPEFTTELNMMFRICYLGFGQYSIRHYKKPTQGLTAMSDGSLMLTNIGTTDRIDGIIEQARWTIDSVSGCVFRNISNNELVISSPAGVTTRAKLVLSKKANISLSDSSCRWYLYAVSNPPTGMYIIDPKTGRKPYSNYTMEIKDTLYISASYYSPDSDISQMIRWNCHNNSLIECSKENAGNIKIRGLKEGSTEISFISPKNNISLTIKIKVLSGTVDVTIVSAYQLLNGNNFGHAFLMIKNNTTTSKKIGHYTLNSEEAITISTWKEREINGITHQGLW